jgi:uncharacterized protein YjbJ (UPF0337 family)
MNWDGIASEWDLVKDKIKGRWGKLTDEDLHRIAGRRDHLIARLRELYGMNEAHAEAQLRDWERHQEPIFFTQAAPAPVAAMALAYAPAPDSSSPHS